ncbi:MAG TPA: hypothetical protein VK668_03360 [Mucilaginibacter sp.]|nr:hypothetical protein [Mucilaginibacter sp.]
MKKAILFSIMASLLLFSCKKDHKNTPDPASKTHKVNFTVSGSSEITSSTGKIQVNSLKTNAQTSIVGYMDLLYYYVFQADGTTLVHALKQDSTQTNFGNISDNLPAGTYTIMIVTGKKGLVLTTAQVLGFNEELIYYSNAPGVTPWLDTFYSKFQITVADADINQNVALNRIVGQLEVKILDTIPVAAKSLAISVKNENFELRIPSMIPYNAKLLTDSIILAASAKGLPNFTVDQIIANTVTPFTVTIKCYDATNKLLGNVTVNSVSCQQNTRTILSGKLFGVGNGYGIGVSDWKPPIYVNF